MFPGSTESWPLVMPLPNIDPVPSDFFPKGTHDPHSKFISFYTGRGGCPIPLSSLGNYENVFLDVGAGSGSFFLELAKFRPQSLLISIERDRMRAKSLIKRTGTRGFQNMVSIRGNIIPTIINHFPEHSIDRIFFLYPCPWPKKRHRKNRWYFHPAMPQFLRCLKPGGLLVWASDESYYIDEARYVCEKFYNLKTLAHGRLSPNPYNHLELMPNGRTKFEMSFLSSEKTCFELVAGKLPFFTETH